MNPITLHPAELKPALAGLGKVINRQASLPVLAAVKIERSKEGWISLTATDMDRFVTVRMEQPSQGQPLALVIGYEDLLRISKSAGKDQPIILEPATKEAAIVKTSLGQQPVAVFPPEEFPPVPRFKADPVPIPDPMRQVLHQALSCASDNGSRPALQGAFIDLSNPGNQSVVATDGKHLFSSNSWNLPLKNSVLIPKHRFLEWKEFNRDGEWQLRVWEGPPHKLVQLSSRRWRFISRQIESAFPKWRDALPNLAHVRLRITLEARTLDNIVRAVERLPSNDSEHQTLGLEWKDNQLTLKAHPPQSMEWVCTPVPDAQGEGPELTVLVNRRYFIKALQYGLNTVEIIDEKSPLRFSHAARQMIVMPVRLDTAARTLPAPQTPPRKRTVRKVPKAPAQTAIHQTPAAQLSSFQAQRPVTAPRIDEALGQVNTLRDSFRSGLAHLRDLATKLKLIRSTQKHSEREVQQARTTIRKIQEVKL